MLDDHPDPMPLSIIVIGIWFVVLVIRLLVVFTSIKAAPRCRNCQRPLRGLRHALDVPVHLDTDSRFCDAAYAGDFPVLKPTRFAEWSE
jgi:hypothetical protein